jgi:hypothetical protein
MILTTVQRMERLRSSEHLGAIRSNARENVRMASQAEEESFMTNGGSK